MYFELISDLQESGWFFKKEIKSIGIWKTYKLIRSIDESIWYFFIAYVVVS